MKNAVSARSERRGWRWSRRSADGEKEEKECEKPDQPGAEEMEVVACGGGNDVDGAVRGAGEEVAAAMAVAFQMPNHWLDCNSVPDLATNGGHGAALPAEDEDARLIVVMAAVDTGMLDGTPVMRAVWMI
ncbi:hypothetical protein [Falsiroseomonas sp. E2-1-a20]|uniref:hypothetical protein n=1 Tax=Falsiroseomonas sp. E2-1-a20 TaxID=3239300 RepID=UPI003F2EA7C6